MTRHRRGGVALPSPEPLRALAETDLVSTWDPDYGADPVLSICCTAYNQVSYIRDAIEGFLAQRTRFPFEVLLHDDASTDGTADVIREYAASHPTIVRAVIRERNLYSRNGMTLGNVLPLARGRWIAVCEGDDYWIRADKLQRQVERMERDGTDLSAHPALGLSPEGRTRLIGSFGPEPRILPLEAVVSQVHPMASTVFRRSALAAFERFRDDVRPRVGDVYMQAIAAIGGGCSYLGEIASVYRERAAGSTTAAGSTLRSAHASVDVVRSVWMLSERYPEAGDTLRAAADRWATIATFDIALAHLDGHPVRAELIPALRTYPVGVSPLARAATAALVLPRGIAAWPLRLYRRARAAWARRRTRRTR